MPLLVGTSGWSYADWRRPYYRGTPPARWFEHLMADFRTVELNVSFYRLPPRATFEGWRSRSPEDAVITVKASRYLTHVRRLRDPAQPVARLLDHATGLGAKLGPLLVQLPPDLPADTAALDRLLRLFPPQLRVAVEPRHPSWSGTDVLAVLAEHSAALVWADRRGVPTGPLRVTAAWGYLRLHEGLGVAGWPFYDRDALGRWVDTLAAAYDDDADVFVYFNNDPRCAAIDNAVTFAEEAARRGRTVTRVPASRPDPAGGPAAGPAPS